MKIYQFIAFAALGIIPALALPESSKPLDARGAYPPFTCSTGKYPVCCKTFLAGASNQPTGTGAQCFAEDKGCASGLVPTCCLVLVCSFFLLLRSEMIPELWLTITEGCASGEDV